MSTPPLVRSALFVPAHRSDFLAKVESSGADAVILDLEDAVGADHRDEARSTASDWLSSRRSTERPCAFVRINAVDAGLLDADLDAAVHGATTGVLVPKVSSAAEIRVVEQSLAYLEGRRGLPLGHTRIWPLLESAQAIVAADDILGASTRVAYAGGGTAAGGDLARDLGFEATTDAAETLYIRSAVLVAARAAGVANPLTGIHTAIDDLSGLRTFAEASRRLGYEGMMVIHPKHAPVVNEVFTPSTATLDHARNVVAALESAPAGNGAVRVDGRMVDAAMASTARRLLARWADVDRR